MVGYTNRYNNEFYFDKDDYNLVSKYCWRLDSDKNVITKENGHRLSMHKLIMGDGIYYHKNGNKSDNRRENLIPARGYRNDGKVRYNGYIAVYMPEHHRAFENGCVYEHILVAEQKLGRKLLELEVVHHIDKDRINNSEDNLIVFATEQDHVLYHAGAKLMKLENGSYKCKRDYQVFYEYINETKDEENKDSIRIIAKKSYKNLCPQCKVNYKTKDAQLCMECANLNRAKRIPSKEELDKILWTTPFTKMGSMYGVSDKAVVRWCKKYGLPHKRKDINTINKSRLEKQP